MYVPVDLYVFPPHTYSLPVCLPPRYVPGETVAALILRALADSQNPAKNALGELVLRPPVRAWSSATTGDHTMGGLPSNGTAEADAVASAGAAGFVPTDHSSAAAASAGDGGDGDGGGDQSSENNAPSRARMREFIRGLNFQLLQLARPENLLVTPLALPKDYRAEYVLRQVSACAMNRWGLSCTCAFLCKRMTDDDTCTDSSPHSVALGAFLCCESHAVPHDGALAQPSLGRSSVLLCPRYTKGMKGDRNRAVIVALCSLDCSRKS